MHIGKLACPCQHFCASPVVEPGRHCTVLEEMHRIMFSRDTVQVNLNHPRQSSKLDLTPLGPRLEGIEAVLFISNVFPTFLIERAVKESFIGVISIFLCVRIVNLKEETSEELARPVDHRDIHFRPWLLSLISLTLLSLFRLIFRIASKHTWQDSRRHQKSADESVLIPRDYTFHLFFLRTHSVDVCIPRHSSHKTRG